MSKAAELAALIGSQTALSNRNLIINGACQVNQRGDSTGQTSGGNYATDRFKTSLSSIGTWSIQNVTDSPAGFSASHKLTCTSADSSVAAGDFAFCRYIIEAQDLQQLDYGASGAKPITLSFYVKSNKTGNATVEINQQDTDPVRAVALQYTINAANTWERKELTILGDASGNINDDTGGGFEIYWWLRSGSTYTGGSHQSAWYERVNADRNASNINVGSANDDYWAITGVQLEVGEQATPFEHRSFADELQKCRRYYEQYDADSGRWIAAGGYEGTTDAEFSFLFNVQKRAAPTVSFTGTSSHFLLKRFGTSNAAAGTLSADNVGVDGFKVNSTSNPSSHTTGQASLFGIYNTAKITVDAEL
jgi:hypothetical protein